MLPNLSCSFKSVIFSLAFLTISACGGGGGGDSSAPITNEISEGLWEGTTESGQVVEGLVLDDGTYYILYTDVYQSYIAGVVQGNSTMSGSSFSSSNAKDFNLEGYGILSASVSGTINSQNSFNGTITYSDTTVSFTTSYNSDYELTPSLSNIQGNYSGAVVFSQGVEVADLTILQDGSLSGVGSSGCTLSGTTYPRASGNVFNVSYTFAGSPCFFANQTFEGILYYDSGNNFLYSVAPNGNRTDGILYLANKLDGP